MNKTIAEQKAELRQRLAELDKESAELRRREREEERRREAEEEEQFKAMLSTKFAVERGPVFDFAFNRAWDRGHSCGLNEVEMEFDDLSDLIHLARKHPAPPTP